MVKWEGRCVEGYTKGAWSRDETAVRCTEGAVGLGRVDDGQGGVSVRKGGDFGELE